MFTTPNTVYVPPEYELATDVPSAAEFVTCSLDGRLWVWKRSRRYYVSAFRWDEDSQRLAFAGTTILNGENLIKRGVDWILTDKSLILSSDDEPYITRTEYESEDTTYIDAINSSYSFFPELETWQKIQSGQVISILDAPSEAWQEMPRNLIDTLEFHYYSNDNIQTFSSFKAQLCYSNGQLYAKGKAHIGRAYLLPRTFTFNPNGESEIMNFYLYVSPDYLREYDAEIQAFDDNDGWDKLVIMPLNSDSVAVFSPQDDAMLMCKKAEHIYTLPQNKAADFSANNGAIFFDTFTGSNLAVNNNAAFLMRDNLLYECKGIQQWIAPAGIIETISAQYAMSLTDDTAIITHFPQGLYREAFREIYQAQKEIPLILTCSSKEVLLSGINKDNKKVINARQPKNARQKYLQAATWQNVFKHFLNIDLITSFKDEEYYFDNHYEEVRGSMTFVKDYIRDINDEESIVDYDVTYTDGAYGEAHPYSLLVYSIYRQPYAKGAAGMSLRYGYIDIDDGTPHIINTTVSLPDIVTATDARTLIGAYPQLPDYLTEVSTEYVANEKAGAYNITHDDNGNPVWEIWETSRTVSNLDEPQELPTFKATKETRYIPLPPYPKSDTWLPADDTVNIILYPHSIQYCNNTGRIRFNVKNLNLPFLQLH